MKVTNKFWAWVGQFIAANIFLWRIDLLCAVFGVIPNFANIDLSQFNFEIGVARFGAFVWLCWLAWRFIKGFSGEMEFLSDAHDRRRW